MKIRLLEFTKSLHLGGTEGQVVEMLRGLDPSCYDISLGLLSDRGPWLESVWKLGYLPTVFPLGKTLVHPKSAFQILRLAGWLKHKQIDLVHVHDFYSTVLVVPAAKLAGCRVVVGRLDLAHWHGKARRLLLAQLTRMADGVVANAEAIKQMLTSEEGVQADKIQVIHNGIDLERFDARAAESLESPLPNTFEDPVAILVANMNHPVKRQEDHLEASALIQATHRFHTFLIGNGPRRQYLEKRAKELGITEVVHFLGHRTDVPAVYARATFGVLCSEAEGLSNAIIEGMASSKPMVVTDVGGSTELIQSGVTGYVVPKRQPEALAWAIKKVLSDPAGSRQLGRQGREVAETRLTLRQMIQNHDRFYRRLLQVA